jgi:hypothetical protein
MAEVALPDAGQPLDLSYLLTLVNEVNNLNRVVSSKAVNQSSIKYSEASGTKNIVTSDLVFYASTNSLSPKFKTGADTTTRFDFNFKTTPIVVTSISMVSGTVAAIFPVITNLSNTSCQIKLFDAKTVSGDPRINVSIIAIGERA